MGPAIKSRGVACGGRRSLRVPDLRGEKRREAMSAPADISDIILQDSEDVRFIIHYFTLPREQRLLLRKYVAITHTHNRFIEDEREAE